MKQINSRFMGAFLLTASLAVAAGAQTVSCATPGTDNAFLGIQTIRLWPGTAPEAKGATCDDIPALTLLEPRQGTAKFAACRWAHGLPHSNPGRGMSHEDTLAVGARNS